MGTPFNLMKFTLTYDGALMSSGNSPKPKEKWAIRRALQPQLAELWETNSALKYVRTTSGWLPRNLERNLLFNERHHNAAPFHQPDFNDTAVFNLCEPIDVGGAKFIPLVRDSLALVCALDILFLRKEEPGALIKKGGDLDNRIKTLFDGLRMPKLDEMQFCQGPIEDPFYCLLEDDSLIADMAVRTGQLLTRPGGNVFDVRLVIDVTVKLTQARTYNLPLLG